MPGSHRRSTRSRDEQLAARDVPLARLARRRRRARARGARSARRSAPGVHRGGCRDRSSAPSWARTASSGCPQLDAVARFELQAVDRAGVRRGDRQLHLHRLEYRAARRPSRRWSPSATRTIRTVPGIGACSESISAPCPVDRAARCARARADARRARSRSSLVGARRRRSGARSPRPSRGLRRRLDADRDVLP